MRSDARWSGLTLLSVFVLMDWLEPGSLSDRFQQAREVFVDVFRRLRRPGRSFSGFVQAQLRHGSQLLAMVRPHLRQLVQQTATDAGVWEINGWVPICSDGTRINAPRTASNQEGLGCCGRDGKDPQCWMTTLLHLPTGLTWDWVVDRGDASERAHLQQMLSCLPSNALLIADAGYSGYDMWDAIIGKKQNFLFRIGANVNLLTDLAAEHGMELRTFRNDLVYLWPKNKHKTHPPLTLRLVKIQDGKETIHLITNVLEPSRLTDTDIQRFYRMRWGVELWFRSLKQTMGLSKLHSHAPRQAMLEFSWAAVGLSLMSLMHVQALIQAGKTPAQATCAGALRVIRQAVRTYANPLAKPGGLMLKLGKTVKDSYSRKNAKASRNYPVKKTYSLSGSPQIRKANEEERALFQQFSIALNPGAFTA